MAPVSQPSLQQLSHRPASPRLQPLLLLAIGIAAIGAVEAQAPRPVRPLQIEDAVGANRFQVQGPLAAVAPDGALVAYGICNTRQNAPPDVAASNRLHSPHLSAGCDIWVATPSGGAARNLTEGQGGNWGPSWSPDGRTLAFFSDRGETARLFLWDREHGTTRMVGDPTKQFLAQEVGRWTPDSRAIVVKLVPAEGISAEVLPSREEPGPTDRVPGSTLRLYRSGAPAAVDSTVLRRPAAPAGRVVDLGLVDVGTGEVRRLAQRVLTSSYLVSPDGTHLAYLESGFPTPAATGGSAMRLHLVTLANGATRTVADGLVQERCCSMSWSPDGRALAYVTSASTPGDSEAGLHLVPVHGGSPIRASGAPAGGFGGSFLPPLWDAEGHSVHVIGQNAVWRVAATTGRATQLFHDPALWLHDIIPGAGGSQAWSPEGRALVVVATEVATQGGLLLRVGPDGRVSRHVESGRSYANPFATPVASADGRTLVLQAESSHEPADLWVTNAVLEDLRRLTAINPQLDRYTFGRAQTIQFTSADGRQLQAALLLPAGYEPGRRYPTMVWVYGSSMGSRNVNRFGLVGQNAYNMQMLATRGYAVLWPDIPVGVGSPMRDLMASVMPAIDRAVELGVVDPERLAVSGQSNGGYSTLALIVQTDRFKAAIMNAGFGDLTAFYGSFGGSWIPWLERQGGGMGVPPWENPQRYVENSPIYFLDRITTPLIIQAGGNDRSIVPYSDQVFTGLNRLNKDVTYLRYEGEGHVLGAYPNLLDYWNRVTAFLATHLQGTGRAAAPPVPRD